MPLWFWIKIQKMLWQMRNNKKLRRFSAIVASVCIGVLSYFVMAVILKYVSPNPIIFELILGSCILVNVLASFLIFKLEQKHDKN